MEPLISAEPYDLRPDAAKFVSTINSAWMKAQALRAKYDAETQRIAGIDPLNWSQKDTGAQIANRALEIQVLQSEAPILRRVADEWPVIRRAERIAASERASAAVEKVRDEIAQQLVGIGYEDDPAAPAEQRYVHHVAMNHPRVATEAATAFSLRGLLHADDDREALAVRANAAENRLRALVARAA